MTNSDENKELLRDEEVTNKGAKSEDYTALLSKIRKQVDIEVNLLLQESIMKNRIRILWR